MNVEAFNDDLSVVMGRHTYESQDIYKVDGTGVTTVQKLDKILVKRGIQYLGALTLVKRGT